MIKVAQTKQTFLFLAPEKVLCKNLFLAREYIVDITYKCLTMHEGKKKIRGTVINENQLTKEVLLPSEPKI